MGVLGGEFPDHLGRFEGFRLLGGELRRPFKHFNCGGPGLTALDRGLGDAFCQAFHVDLLATLGRNHLDGFALECVTGILTRHQAKTGTGLGGHLQQLLRAEVRDQLAVLDQEGSDRCDLFWTHLETLVTNLHRDGTRKRWSRETRNCLVHHC